MKDRRYEVIWNRWEFEREAQQWCQTNFGYIPALVCSGDSTLPQSFGGRGRIDKLEFNSEQDALLFSLCWLHLTND